MRWIIGLAAIWLAAPGQMVVTDPAVPPNAAMGGTVVASVSLRPGSEVQIRILSGEDPFSGPVQQALSQWQFPSGIKDEAVLVVVNFRQPGMFALGDENTTVAEPSGAPKSLPYPRVIAEPAYPPNGAGQGSVVFEVQLSPSGSIDKVRTVKGLGSLTDAAMAALRSWEFAPARDDAGRPQSSTAFVVFVFRTPVLADPVAQPR